MTSEFKITRQVEFAETDMAGIMHFSNFFRYMEACETAFFRSIGFTLLDPTGGQGHGWPRVHASCDYKAPLQFGDSVEIHLYVKEIRARSLNYFFRFWKLVPGGKPEPVAYGELTVVCVAHDKMVRKMVSREIPDDVLAKIKSASPRDFGI